MIIENRRSRRKNFRVISRSIYQRTDRQVYGRSLRQSEGKTIDLSGMSTGKGLPAHHVDWLQSLKRFFINVSYHILIASLTLMALVQNRAIRVRLATSV